MSESLVLAILSSAVVSLLLVTVPSEAQSSNTAPTTLVGATSAPQSVTVTLTTAGTLSAINVLTLGAPNMDYKFVSGGSCASGTYTLPASCTVLYSFTPSSPWFRYGGISLADSDGHILGSSFISGIGTGPQVSYPISATTAVSPLSTTLSSPSGIAVDGSGNIYLADATNVIELNAAGSTINTWSTGFVTPKGVAIDGSGNLYVADSGSTAIEKLIAVGGTVPSNATPVPIDGGSFSSPTAVAVDGSGNVFVADMNDIKEIVASSGTVVTLNAASSFSLPSGVAVDGSGNVYVADTGDGAIKKLPATSGTVTPGSAATTLANFTSPTGIAVDGTGNLYVADASATPIQQINAAGADPVTLGSGFSSPKGLAVDAGGNVFVADTSSNAARKMSAQTPPTVAFAATTPVGTTNTDGLRSVTVANNGNAALTFAGPPSISDNFTLVPSPPASTCPQLTTLAQGASCTDSISFVPTHAGPITGSLTMTDNTLNGAGSMQPIPLTGTGSLGTLTVTVSAPSTFVNSNSVLLTAMIAYGGATPTGQVSFQVNGGSTFNATNCTGLSSPLICMATFNPSSLPVTALGYPIVASVATDNNYNSNSASGTLTMAAAPTTLLISPTTPSAVNASVTLTATLSSTTGFTPISTIMGTDTVSFTANGVTLCAAAPLSPTSHTATCSTTSASLTAGSYTIAATYNPGTDPNFQTSMATSVTQMVTAAPTTLLISPTTPSIVNASVTLTATLSSTTGFTPISTIMGTDTVSFTASGVPLCAAAPLSPATHMATCSTTSAALTAGSDSIVATYNPGTDPNFQTSTASPVIQTVAAVPATLAITLPTSGTVDVSTTLTATLSSIATFSPISTAAADTVTFFNGTTVLCTGTISTTTHVAMCPTSLLVQGTDVITATFSTGDPNFYAANTASTSLTVSPATTATTVSPASNSVNVNQAVTLTATVAPTAGNSVPTVPQTGTISFSDSISGAIATCTNINIVAGAATCSPSFTSVGTHTITATFTSTDHNFSGGTPGTTMVQVGTSGTSLAITPGSSNPTPLFVDQTGNTFSAAIANFPSNVPGTLTFYDGASAISGTNCSGVSIPPSGVPAAPCAYTFVSAGPHSIKAVFTQTGGSIPLALTSNVLSVTVAQTPLTISAIPPSPQVDTPTTFSATVSLVAPITDTATGDAIPSGSITFAPVAPDPTAPCTAPVTTTGANIGQASCQLNFGTAGPHAVMVSYIDPNFVATSILDNVTVAKTALMLTLTTTTAPLNTATAFTATVSLPSNATNNAAGNSAPNGNIILTPDAGAPCTTPMVKMTTSGIGASCSLTFGTAGTHTITVSYGSDTNFSASSIVPPVSIAQATPIIVFTSPSATSSAASLATQAVTFTATVTSTTGGIPPTKTVSFTVPQTTQTIPYPCTLVTSTLTAGTASCSVTATFLSSASGPLSVTATYSGDSNYITATTSFAQTVQNFMLSSPAANLTFSQNSTNLSDAYTHQAIGLTATPQGGFADTNNLILSCAFTPAMSGLSCSSTLGLNGATITANSSVPPGAYTVTYTVTDTLTGLSHPAPASTNIMILNQAAPVYVSLVGTGSASFTVPPGVSTTSLSCSSTLATLVSAGMYTTSTNQTLAGAGLQCSIPISSGSSGSGYSVTITAGSLSTARLETKNGRLILASLGAPFLLILGFLPASKKLRKTLLNSLAVLILGALLLQTTGCGSGGFSRTGTNAATGSYLIDIVNSQGTTVAEVPVFVQN